MFMLLETTQVDLRGAFDVKQLEAEQAETQMRNLGRNENGRGFSFDG